MGFAFGYALMLAVMGFGIAVPVLVILNAWWVEQTMDTGPALGALAVLFVALFALWGSQGTAWMFVCIAALAGGCAALPLITGQANKRALRGLVEDRIERYQEAIRFNPGNAAAHAYLGDAYVELGRLEDAIDAYQKAIDLAPNHSETERAKLRKAVEMRQGASTHIVVCDDCRGESPEGSTACRHCGARLRMSFFAWLARPENLKAVTRRSVGALLVLTVLLALISALPLEVKGCVLIATLFVGAFYFLRTVGGER